MSQTVIRKQVGAQRIGHQTPRLRLPDAASSAQNALVQAMEYCAEKMGLADGQAAVERIQNGDPAACSYCHYSLAKQIADTLGSLDESIQAVYVFDYEATPQDVCFTEVAQPTPVHLLVWTSRRTEALTSLAEALDRTLAEGLSNMLGRSPRAHVLDVQIVDNADVENRTGYGALLSSLYHRPIKVWER